MVNHHDQTLITADRTRVVSRMLTHTPTEGVDATTAEPAIPTASVEDYSEPEVSGPNLDPTADRITGKVIRIADGDTLTILNGDNEQIKVRFNGIDAPEKAQAFGDKSKQALGNRRYRCSHLRCCRSRPCGHNRS